MSTSEAARLLGISYDRLYRLFRTRRYRPWKNGGRYVIPEADLPKLKELIEAGRAPARYPKKYGIYGKTRT